MAGRSGKDVKVWRRKVRYVKDVKYGGAHHGQRKVGQGKLTQCVVALDKKTDLFPHHLRSKRNLRS